MRITLSKIGALALLALSLPLAAQTINPNQIRPSSTNGNVLTTQSGVTTWASPAGCGGTGPCIVANPTASQQIAQPTGTSFTFLDGTTATPINFNNNGGWNFNGNGNALFSGTGNVTFSNGGAFTLQPSGLLTINSSNFQISAALNLSTDSGTANAYVLTPPFPTAANQAGGIVTWIAKNSSTGASTLAYGVSAAVPLTHLGGVAIASGDILANHEYMAMYDAQQNAWVLLGGGGGGSGLPSATAPGQIIASTGAGTTYGVQSQLFYSHSGDTIASIEAKCSSLCAYIVTQPMTFTLTANHTLSSNVFLQFDADGTWTLNGSGFTLTIPNAVIGSLSEHFPGGTANVSLNGVNGKTPMEWFGFVADWNGTTGTDNTAAMQACINAITFGQCTFAGNAAFAGPVSITSSYVGIAGRGNVGRGGYGASGTNVLVQTSATADGIDVDGTSSSAPVTYGTFENFTLNRSPVATGTTDAGLSFSFTAGVTVRNVAVNNSHRDFYIHSSPSYGTGGFFHDQADWLQSQTTTGWVGYYLDTADGNAENSLTMRDDAVGQGGGFASGFGSTGWLLTGTAVNDNNTWNFACASVSICQEVDYTGSGSGFAAGDIHLNSTTADNMPNSGTGILIENLSAAQDGSVTINDARISSNQGVTAGIDIENSSGISVGGGTQCLGGFPCIFANASTGLSLSNIVSYSSASGAITLQGTTGSTVTGNSIIGASQGILVKNNSNYNTITGNSFSNATSQKIGIIFQSGSTGNVYSGNSFDSTVTNTEEDSSGGTNGSVNLTGPAAGGPAFTLFNSTTNGYTQLRYSGTSHIYQEGVGNGSETNLGVANKWYVYDSTNSAMRLALDATGDLALGYATPYPTSFPALFNVGTSGQFQTDSSGDVTLTNPTAATSSTAQNSPTMNWKGQSWSGSASATTTWSCQIQYNTAAGFTNPPGNLTCSSSGANGGAFTVSNASIANFTGVNFNLFGSPDTFLGAVNSNTVATSSANYDSPEWGWSGNYYNIAQAANATDEWLFQDVMGTGHNPPTVFKLIHTGSVGPGPSPGASSVDLTAANTTKIENLAGASGVTSTVGAPAGTGATLTTASGFSLDSIGGTLTLTTGTGPTAGVVATVTFPVSRANNTNCIVNMESNSGRVTALTTQNTSTTVAWDATTGLTASTTYTLRYLCEGN